MTARDILLAAADHLEAHGWIQGRFGAEHGVPCCAVGATNAVAPDHLAARVAARRMLEAYLGIGMFEIPRWNDAPGRTATEVVAALRGAAGGVP